MAEDSLEEEAAVGEEEVGKVKFSIVIIALNEEKYIGKILKDLTEQTYKDFEVVVVDGQSEDKTVEVVKSYKDDLDLKIVISDKRGPSYQRNLGVKHTKYDEIIFFDSDIAITNNFIEKLNAFVEKSGVGSITGLYKPLESSLYNHWSMFIQNLYILLREKIYPVATGSVIYVNKEAFHKAGGFDERLVYAEDSDLVQKIWKNGDGFKVIKNPKVYWSCRRLKKEGNLKHSLWLIWAQIRLLFGKKFYDENKKIYEFGHYNKE